MSPARNPLAERTPDLVTTWPQVCGWRLERQHVTRPADDLLTVAAALGGVQAQVTSSARFTVGLRSPGTTADELDAALWTDRSLVKTWAMRGTLHWLASSEYALWVSALTTREWRITPSWERYHGVTAAELAAITEAIPEALAGRRLTRDELAQRLADLTANPHLGEQLRSGWGAVLKPAANRGLLCFGPDRGRNVTFVRPDDWLGDIGPAPAPADALWQVLRRFLDAYGPATHADFGRWFGVPERAARALFAAHADQLVVAAIDGHRAWLTTEGAARLSRSAAADGVALLGGFDPYVLAPISHRDVIVPAGHLDDVSRTAGWISAVVLVNGFVAGTWTAAPRDRGTALTVTPFTTLSATDVAAIERRGAELADRLVDGPVTVEIAAAGG